MVTGHVAGGPCESSERVRNIGDDARGTGDITTDNVLLDVAHVGQHRRELWRAGSAWDDAQNRVATPSHNDDLAEESTSNCLPSKKILEMARMTWAAACAAQSICGSAMPSAHSGEQSRDRMASGRRPRMSLVETEVLDSAGEKYRKEGPPEVSRATTRRAGTGHTATRDRVRRRSRGAKTQLHYGSQGELQTSAGWS